MLNYTA